MKLSYYHSSFPASRLFSRTWRTPLSLSSFNQAPIMAEKADSTGSYVGRSLATITSDSFHEIFHSDSDGGWEKVWKKGMTPWDLGQPTPILEHLHNTGSLPNGKALIPGCGSGYDVMAIACPERRVVGLDLSEDALNKAAELSSSSPNAEYCTFVKADFFKWCPTEPFDLIFDYTFFCAIAPSLRADWAVKIGDLLKSDGELLTLIYPISDHEGGPPYKVSVADYEDVLHPLGFKAITVEDNDLAIKPRKGREKIARWKRCPSVSSL